MYFKKYSSTDFEQAKSFIESCKSSEISIDPLEQSACIMAISESSEIIALGMQWRNNLHNRTIVVEICVLPNKRRTGIGTAVFKKLMKTFPPKESDFALDMKCESDNFAAQAFAEHLGFVKYLEGYNNIFEIDEMTLVKDELNFISLLDFYQGEHGKERARAFHCLIYDRDHEPFVPVNQENRYAYCSDGNPEYGVVVQKDQEIIGCSFALLNFEKQLGKNKKDVTCLHGYAVGSSIVEEASIVQALYSYQMRLLRSHGRKNVYIEFDSIERISDMMLEWIPYSKDPILRFQKILKN